MSKAKDDPEFMTTEEVARRLRANTETIRRYVRTGVLRAVRIGRKMLISQAEFARFVSEQTKPTVKR